MESVYKAVQAAVDQARQAYEFSANSYTFDAFNKALLALKHLRECDLINQRMSY